MGVRQCGEWGLQSLLPHKPSRVALKMCADEHRQRNGRVSGGSPRGAHGDGRR